MSYQTPNTLPWHPPTSPPSCPSCPAVNEALAASWPCPSLLPLYRKRQEAVARMLHLHPLCHPLRSLCSTEIVAYDMLIPYPFFQVIESNFPRYTAQFNSIDFCGSFIVEVIPLCIPLAVFFIYLKSIVYCWLGITFSDTKTDPVFRQRNYIPASGTIHLPIGVTLSP